MSLTDRAGLINAICGWLNRDALAAQAPDFIRLAEVRMNRLLRDPDQITTGTIDTTNGAGNLPSDFGEMIAFGPIGSRLSQVTPGEFGTYLAQAGDPRVYTVSGGKVMVLPSMGAASVPITYYRAIPALTDSNPTNWLLTRAPDLYLYGSLLQAELFGWNDERLPILKQGWDEGIAELRADGANRRWGAAPLSAKVRRT